MCSDLHRLRISTLDSFYNELARNFSLELDLPPGWRLADPYEERSLQSQAISRTLYAIDQDQLHSLISQLCKGEAIRGVWREIASTVEAGYPIYLSTNRNAWMQKFVAATPSNEMLQKAIEAINGSQCADRRWVAAREKLIECYFSGDSKSFLANKLVDEARKGKELTYYRKPIEPDITESLIQLASMLLAKEFAVLEQQNASAYELLANYHSQLELVKRRDRILTFADVSLRLSAWMQRRLEATAQKAQAEDEPDE